MCIIHRPDQHRRLGGVTQGRPVCADCTWAEQISLPRTSELLFPPYTPPGCGEAHMLPPRPTQKEKNSIGPNTQYLIIL